MGLMNSMFWAWIVEKSRTISVGGDNEEQLVQENQQDEADNDVDEEAEVMEAQQRFFTRFDITSDYSSGNEM